MEEEKMDASAGADDVDNKIKTGKGKPKKKLWLILVLVIILVAAGSAGAWYYKDKDKKTDTTANTATDAAETAVTTETTSTPTATTTPATTDETANWKTFNFSDRNYSIKYPQAWQPLSDSIDARTAGDLILDSATTLAERQEYKRQNPQGGPNPPDFEMELHYHNSINTLQDLGEGPAGTTAKNVVEYLEKNKTAGRITSYTSKKVGAYEGYEVIVKMSTTYLAYYLELGGHIYIFDFPRISSSTSLSSEDQKVLSTFQFTDPTIGWKTYTNSTYGFSFKYPSDWKITEPSADTYGSGTNVYGEKIKNHVDFTVYVEYKSGDAYLQKGEASVSIQRWPNIELSQKDDWFTEKFFRSKVTNPDSQVVIPEADLADITFLGKPAKKQRTVATKVAEGLPGTNNLIYFEMDGKIWTISYSAPTNGSSKDSELEAIFNNFYSSFEEL